MVTVVIAARIGRPVQSASVKEGMNWLPELTGPCVPESRYTADAGRFPQLDFSTWAPSQAGCARGASSSWKPPLAQQSRWEGRGRMLLLQILLQKSQGGLPSFQLGHVRGPSSVPVVGGGLRLDRCSPVGSLGSQCQLKREGLRVAKRLFISRN